VLAANAVLVARDGATIAIQDSAAPIQDRNGGIVGAVMVFHDVSTERQLHRKLSYHASHDSLTGLINRREFEERLSAAVRSVADGAIETFALLYMDLDQFKIVNDTCGHAAGDLLLRQLADVLQQRVRTHDVIARLGGDEFAVLLLDCPAPRASEIAEQLREAVSRFRFTWRDGSMQVGASIGIVPAGKDNEGVAALMSAADVACYVAKDLGRNRIHVYEEGDAAERHQEMQWIARINRAREQERLELYYQPIVPIGGASKEYPHFELLLRMRDESGELVMPNAFIPAAERYNLMQSLDRWVIHEVLEGLVYREQSGTAPYTLAVNLSGTSLNDARFLDFLLGELSAAHVPEGALCFEITETAAIANLGTVVRFMQALREHGCLFSLDDFGTGLSSLTYLKNLPVDYVKIDGQFIRNVTKDAADESVVDAIARMARAFNIRTIAERVESREVFLRLGEIGIMYAQGYYIAVPQPIADLPIRRQVSRFRA
jgi:diguanylate cyclase (GGDEF)-like protein